MNVVTPGRLNKGLKIKIRVTEVAATRHSYKGHNSDNEEAVAFIFSLGLLSVYIPTVVVYHYNISSYLYELPDNI